MLIVAQQLQAMTNMVDAKLLATAQLNRLVRSLCLQSKRLAGFRVCTRYNCIQLRGNVEW